MLLSARPPPFGKDPVVLLFVAMFREHLLLQFATFSLLGLYFIKAVFKAQWNANYRVGYILFAAALLSVTVLIGLSAVERGEAPDDGSSSKETAQQLNWESTEAALVGIVFLALSFGFLGVSIKVFRMTPADWSRTLVEQVWLLSAHYCTCSAVMSRARVIFAE